MSDAGFRDYEREFQRLTQNIPTRVEAVLKFESDNGAEGGGGRVWRPHPGPVPKPNRLGLCRAPPQRPKPRSSGESSRT